MEKSRASWQLRQALKCRTRKWRRRQVRGFYIFLFLMPLVILGDDHHGLRHFLWALFPFVIAWGAGSRWFRSQQRIVRGLDDWAQVRHGVNFDQLSETEQSEILRKYPRAVLDVEWYGDERQQALRLQAKDTAYRILGSGSV